MPELPEVQTIIDHLKNQDLLNHVIKDIVVTKPKIFKNTSSSSIKDIIIGQKIIEIFRKGKYLIFVLNSGSVFTIHLRMEGKLFLLDNGDADTKHMMFKFLLDNNKKLIYDDSRMFGTFRLYKDLKEASNSDELIKVAIDPLDKNFNSEYVESVFKKCNKHIKTALLDQTKISGIGNIYANEILFCSKISPLRIASQLSKKEYKQIAYWSPIILKESIANKGTTVFSYKFDPSHSGQYQNMLKVHTRTNQPCLECKTPILKIRVNNRGTYYCPKCQR